MLSNKQLLDEAKRSRRIARISLLVPLLLIALIASWAASGVHLTSRTYHKFKRIYIATRADDQIPRPLIQHVPRADNSNVCTSFACTEFSNSIRSNLSPNLTAVDPCQQFDQFACGGFIETHNFRSEQVSVSTRSVLADLTYAVVRDILDGPYHDNPDLSSANGTLHRVNYDKLKTAYSACLDQNAIKQAGIAPLVAMLEELETHYPVLVPDSPSETSARDELTNAILWLSKNSVPTFISTGTSIDNKNPDTYIVRVDVAKFGLPSKQYYNRPGAVANYTRSIAQMFEIMLPNNPNITTTNNYINLAQGIIELETKLSKSSADKNKARDVSFFYNPMPLADVDGLVPQISIMDLITSQIPQGYEVQNVIVSDPQYLNNLSSIIASTPREVLHAYLQWQVINNWGRWLHSDFNKPMRAFHNQLDGLGQDSKPDRRKVCRDEVDTNLGWILSGLYIERVFDPMAKDYADQIMSNIKEVFAERLKTLDWMSDAVKERAARKVVNIVQQVGYPTVSPAILDPSDVQKYYEGLQISRTNYFANGRSYKRFVYERSWNDLLKPVDRHRWKMTAPTINASFNSILNRISFPAGILQPPSLSPELPEYVSYGAFGWTAGHELTHGFDNSGSQYDETGRFATWWDNSTLSSFQSRAQCFIDQYSKYSVSGVDGEPVHVNGKLTLGENIADAGGLASSFAAWQRREEQNPNQVLPGLEQFSKEQMFYISYANWRCGKTRPAQLVKTVLTDEHSPVGIRELGALANSRGFREAFNCPVKEPTCELW